MAAFTFDTSGAVEVPYDRDKRIKIVRWSDLSPFMQGYVRAAFESLEATCERCQGNGEVVTDWERYRHAHPGDVGDEAVATCPDCGGQEVRPLAFRMIAPATLAAMMADCEGIGFGQGKFYADTERQGGHFWNDRQHGSFANFPPLTLTIHDDGLVYQEART